MSIKSTSEIGREGEELAVRYLEAHGFRILHRNWRHGRYELDIVAQKDESIHFVEVKCRKLGSLTSPEEAISPAKFRSLTKAAEAYIELFGVEAEVQFDAVAVDYHDGFCQVRYIPEAMIHRW